MASRVERAFHFPLQPELVRCTGRRDSLLAELRVLQGALERASKQVRDCEQAIEDCRHEADRLRERLRVGLRASLHGLSWTEAAAAATDLCEEDARLHGELKRLRAEERVALHKVELLHSEIGREQARVSSLETMACERRREHAKSLAKQDEERRDSEAIERWTHPSRNRP